MNRQEAAIIIKAIGKHAIETHLTDPGDIMDATVMAVEALVPKPDEVTGLVPCGCGEKAVTLVVRAVSVGYFADHICCKCHTKSTGFGVEAEDAVENVKNIWNTARGYKEDA